MRTNLPNYRVCITIYDEQTGIEQPASVLDKPLYSNPREIEQQAGIALTIFNNRDKVKFEKTFYADDHYQDEEDLEEESEANKEK